MKYVIASVAFLAVSFGWTLSGGELTYMVGVCSSVAYNFVFRFYEMIESEKHDDL